MVNYFKFGNFDSRDYGIYISFARSIPATPAVLQAIPGGFGSVVVGREYQDEVIEYPAFFAPTNAGKFGITNATSVVEAIQYLRTLAMQGSQAALSDSFMAAGTYRDAVFLGDEELEITPTLDAASMVLKFSAKAPINYGTFSNLDVAANTSVTTAVMSSLKTNVEWIIEVTGTGFFTITGGGETYTAIINENQDKITIDAHMRECYTSTGAANQLVEQTSFKFPAFGMQYGSIAQLYTITTVGVSLKISSFRWTL